MVEKQLLKKQKVAPSEDVTAEVDNATEEAKEDSVSASSDLSGQDGSGTVERKEDAEEGDLHEEEAVDAEAQKVCEHVTCPQHGVQILALL